MYKLIRMDEPGESQFESEDMEKVKWVLGDILIDDMLMEKPNVWAIIDDNSQVYLSASICIFPTGGE